MEAEQGDRIIVPYLVRFDDGHETIMYPGGDFAVDRGLGKQGGNGEQAEGLMRG